MTQPETNPDRWRRIEELFHAALESEPADRPAWLERACGGDVRLKQQLESLLGVADHSLGFLQRPVNEAASQFAAASNSAPGQMVGPYRILQLLGEGGMGSVYLAQRADEQFEQRVALKLMRTALGPNEPLRERFRTERQILANLQHPNIAHLLDGGVTPDGAPFLVMEYVDGPRIDKYCGQKQLPLRDRLQLFRGICDAVAHAHKNLVVHRDLKPANILVTADGAPKLLDFGIAKLLDADLASAGLCPQTERLMTPDYASPEQILGQRSPPPPMSMHWEYCSMSCWRKRGHFTWPDRLPGRPRE